MFYVTMTDSFLSKWGKADGRTNKFVVECETWDEAITIKRNAMKRPEMKYVNILPKKPKYNPYVYYPSFTTYNELGDVWKK